MRKFTSDYRGVSYNKRETKKPWKARFQYKGNEHNVGAFTTERAAALEVDKARIRVGLDPVNILKRKEVNGHV